MVINNPLSKLDKGQKEAVISQNQHILCLAGAGSGKTRVLTTKIYYLVNHLKVKPENILAITFTKNAANEMLERLKCFNISTDKLWCRTFHSTCYKILYENNSTSSSKIIDEHSQDNLFKICIKSLYSSRNLGYRLSRFLEENNWPEYLFSEEVIKIIHECKNHSLSPNDIVKNCKKEKNEDILEFYRLFYAIYSTYQKNLEKYNLMDFSDLINKTIIFLKSNTRLSAKYQNKFKYLLVDEFQDTNYSQIKIIELIKGKNNNLFAVGDDWQAIYGWRGGNVEYILNFKRIYKNNKTITLPYNYRSDGNIVYAASKCIMKNKSQCRKKIKSFNPRNAKIKIFKGSDENNCLNFIIRTINKLLKYNIKQNDIMILGRNWKNVDIYQKNFPELGLNNIAITTIHGSKGLESDVVFIVGLHKGRGGFPNIKDDHELLQVIKKTPKSERLEEERRCFYVAVTRAKKLLFLVTENGKESEFLNEVPKRYREEIV